MNAKADSEKWLILGFTIGVQIPAAVEYFFITRPALDHTQVLRVRQNVQPGLFFWRYRDRSSKQTSYPKFYAGS